MKRMEIYEKYPFVVVLHFSTKNEIQSDAGGKITSEYFVFYFRKDKEKEWTEKVICGRPTAKKFCQLYDIEMPQIFNPFVSEQKGGGSSSKGTEDDDYWNPTCKQLYNVVMIFLKLHGDQYNKVPIDILNQINKNHGDNYKKENIKSINTFYKKCKTTAKNDIRILEGQGECKQYKFDLLINYLLEEKTTQYLE